VKATMYTSPWEDIGVLTCQSARDWVVLLGVDPEGMVGGKGGRQVAKGAEWPAAACSKRLGKDARWRVYHTGLSQKVRKKGKKKGRKKMTRICRDRVTGEGSKCKWVRFRERCNSEVDLSGQMV